MTEVASETRRGWIRRTLAILLAGMAVIGAIDLAVDSPSPWRGYHGAVELSFILLALASAWVMGRGWYGAEGSLLEARESIRARVAERDAWATRARTALNGLNEAVDQQFEAWGLTPAEKETALFLLKGFSHKEVATLSGRGERTARQHAVAVYRKSGLSGRAELSAFFFEDMFLPVEESPGEETS